MAEISELGDELWAVYGERILRNFDPAGPGAVRNQVLFEQWEKAKQVWERRHGKPEDVSRVRSEAGKKGAATRWLSRKPGLETGNEPEADGKPMAFAIERMATDGCTEQYITKDNDKDATGEVLSTTQRQSSRAQLVTIAPFVLPEWVDGEAWEGFEEMRKSIKKALSPRARQLAVGELRKLKNSGEDPKQVLEQSTLRSWAGLFPVKNTEARQGKKTDPLAGMRFVNGGAN